MNTIAPFALERYFARHEFTATHLLSCSDAEPMAMSEVLAMASSEHRELWDNLLLSYTESQGLPALRQAIAENHKTISPEDVLVLSPAEGIFLFMQAVLEKGDHVVSMRPAYQSLYEDAASMGCTVSFWEPSNTNGQWHWSVDELEALLQPETKLVVVNFPHNPTGFVPQEQDFTRLVQMLEERDIRLFCDEMYHGLELDRQTLPSACELSEKACILSGMSKSLRMPGIRIGWLISRDSQLLGTIAGLKDYTTICNSAPSEILALIGLDHKQSIQAQCREIVLANRELAESFCNRHPELFQWNRPHGGTTAFVGIHHPQGAHAFCDAVVSRAGIMIAPSNMFGFSNDHVRFGLGRKSFPAALAELEKAISKTSA